MILTMTQSKEKNFSLASFISSMMPATKKRSFAKTGNILRHMEGGFTWLIIETKDFSACQSIIGNFLERSNSFLQFPENGFWGIWKVIVQNLVGWPLFLSKSKTRLAIEVVDFYFLFCTLYINMGDYEATLFSTHSHNREFGKEFPGRIRGLYLQWIVLFVNWNLFPLELCEWTQVFGNLEWTRWQQLL